MNEDLKAFLKPFLKAFLSGMLFGSLLFIVLAFWNQEKRLQTLEAHDQRMKEHVQNIEWYLAADGPEPLQDGI